MWLAGPKHSTVASATHNLPEGSSSSDLLAMLWSDGKSTTGVQDITCIKWAHGLAQRSRTQLPVHGQSERSLHPVPCYSNSRGLQPEDSAQGSVSCVYEAACTDGLSIAGCSCLACCHLTSVACRACQGSQHSEQAVRGSACSPPKLWS